METLDEQFLGNNPNSVPDDKIVYGTLWPRIGAHFLDFIVMAPVLVGLTFYNTLAWKSSVLHVLICLLAMAYRPVMEHLYGYTLGKKWLNLQVINQEGDAPTWSQALLRNGFMLAISIHSMVKTLWLFQLPDFAEVHTYMEYNAFVLLHRDYSWVTTLIGFVLLADVIVLVRDRQKRSLHDQIARTWVVKP